MISPEALQRNGAALEGLEAYRKLQRYYARRNHWSVRWIKTRPEGFFNKHASYRAKLSQGADEYKKLSQEAAEKHIWQWAGDEVCLKGPGAPISNDNAVKPQKELRSTAALITWNVKPCKDPTFVTLWRALQLCQPEGPEYGRLLADLSPLQLVVRAWQGFRKYCTKLQTRRAGARKSAPAWR